MPEGTTDEETRSSQRPIQWVEVNKLLLDAQNPRLASAAVEPTQDALLEVLWNEMAVDEVALSIAANGYYENEELLVIRDDADPECYIVVEGNRRLAAVQLLRDAGLREQLRATDIPEIGDLAQAELDQLPVVVYGDREELWAFVGFQHVNGAKPWDAFSKAQFVALVREEYGEPIEEIARRIGDKHQTVRKIYLGYRVLRQARDSGVYDPEQRYRKKLHFSHLYTALDQRSFRDFLGITDESIDEPSPVPEDKLKELGELMIWLFGHGPDNLSPAVKTQAPYLNYLREVIRDEAALTILRTENDLDAAWRISEGEGRLFHEAIYNAKYQLQEAMKNVATGYEDNPKLYSSIEDIYHLAQDLLYNVNQQRERGEAPQIGMQTADREGHDDSTAT